MASETKSKKAEEQDSSGCRGCHLCCGLGKIIRVVTSVVD